jgi:hypothetical protein
MRKQTFHEQEIRYLISRAIRYGINIGKSLDKGIFVQQEIDAYLNEVVPSFMSKAKPTAGSDKPYTKIKKADAFGTSLSPFRNKE